MNPLFAWVDVPGDAPAQVGTITVSVDITDVDRIATVEAFDDFAVGEQTCARTGVVIRCALPGPFDLEPGTNLLPVAALTVTAKQGAGKGAHGKLAYTAQLDDRPEVTAQSTVTIGEGVDLAGVIGEPVTVAPGAVVATEVRVSNAGAVPVRGAVLVLVGWDPSLVDGKGFSNCRYGILTVCTFDDELASGRTYELSMPMRLRIPADAAAGSRASAFGSWYTPSDFTELMDLAPGSGAEALGPKGGGGAVTLQAVPATKSSSAAARRADTTSEPTADAPTPVVVSQVDTKPENNILISEVVVGGSRRTDLAAVGGTITAAAGDRVHARVGFTNNGPGTLYHWSFQNTDPATHLTVPAGLTAVQVDPRCIPLDLVTGLDDEQDGAGQDDAIAVTDVEDIDLTGAAEYVCALEDGRTKAKASALFDFTFEVRDDATAAPGQVRINEKLFTDSGALDRDHHNDTAKITVRLSGDDGGQGGGLPVTGANVSLLGAAGGVLLLAGAAGLLLMRRRRIRFTA
ncbi:LPXTG cell wall anchor domain-containing protein [Krasilnikovia sp. M28-CT-15]|uniref:LPXTG cell wall anchor domain-containing protein n=1 Tax=Krasilnikovia sp. M28-CT-15 TaxID=3373540 RepID=UPI00399CC12F